MLKRLRLRFVLVNMLLVTGMLLAILGLVLHLTARGLEAESLRMLETAAAMPLQQGGPGGHREERPRQPHLVLELDLAGQLRAAGGTLYDLTDQALLQELADEALAVGAPAGVLEGHALRFLSVETPAGRKLAFADLTSEQAALARLARSCAAIGGAAFLAFLLLSVLLARWAAGPVEEAWRQQRQFVADASHELKTPLTVILTNAELLQAPGQDEEQRARSAAGILAMARRMRGLTEQLLELARADSGALRAAMAPLDLSRLLADTLLPFEPLCFEKGLDLTSQIEPRLTVLGSEVHLRQTAEILLDNAVKYTPAGGRVTVSLARQGRALRLAVSNTGEPIPAGELTRIFGRFYRTDKARQSGQGYGLGLAIAHKIVQEHGGRIWAESGGGANTFFVQLAAGRQEAGAGHPL